MKQNLGRRKMDKISKIGGYVDIGMKVVITTLIAFGVNVIMQVNTNIAVIKVSYEHMIGNIERNEKKLKEHDLCLKDHEKRLIIIEKI